MSVNGLRHERMRSKVTNGASLFAWQGDGRTVEARRFRDILAQILEDLGGEGEVTESKRQMARRMALLAVEAERQEFGYVVERGEFDLAAYCKASAEIRLIAMALGVVERVAKPVGSGSSAGVTLDHHGERLREPDVDAA